MRSLIAVLTLVLLPLAGLSVLLLAETMGGGTPVPDIAGSTEDTPDRIPVRENPPVEIRRRTATPERVAVAPPARVAPGSKRSSRRSQAVPALDRSKRVTVQLVSAIDDTPIARTSVRIGDHRRGETDGRGRLTLEAGRRRSMRLRPDGYPLVEIPLPGTSGREASEVPVFRIAPQGELRGTVLGARGEFLDRARVSLQSTGRRDHEQLRYLGRRWAKVGPTGEFRIGGLPVRTPFRLYVTARDAPSRWPPDELTLEPRTVTTIHVRMPGCGIVHGRVLDQYGQSLPNVAVSAGNRCHSGSRFTRSNASGEFLLQGVPLGAGAVTARPALATRYTHLGFPDTTVPIEIERHGEVVSTVIRVHRGRFVEGLVVGSDGQGVSGATVAAVEPMGNLPVAWITSPRERRKTDAHGRFRIGPFDPGKVKVCAFESDTSCNCRSDPREVDSSSRGVVLRLVRMARISGRVLHEKDGFRVRVYAFSRRGDRTQSTRLEPDGGFTIQPLEPGLYDLYAVPPDGRAGGREGVRVGAGDVLEDVRIRVEHRCAVSVRLSGPGRPVNLHERPVTCAIHRNGELLLCRTLVDSPQMRIPVPPGPLEIQLWLRGRTGTRAELKRSTVIRLGDTYGIDWSIPERRPGE